MALPESQALRYLYESVGIEPWLGSDNASGMPSNSAGEYYMETTKKGLTRELGYVGNYGEVLDWICELYEATRPSLNAPGDAKIKVQIEKMALARTYFRYPAMDEGGYNAMRLETVVGWRDTEYPGNVVYDQRASWDGSPFQIAATLQNPKLLSYAQQMLSDNQFFRAIDRHMENGNFRVTAGLLHVPERYDTIKAALKRKTHLPMSWDKPDIVFSDEEDGVVAIKNGKELLYASLYWRARYGINNLARVHYITPNYSNISTVRIYEEFEPSGMIYTAPDWTNMAFGNGGLKYPDGLHSAYIGEKLPIAKIPEDMSFRPGDENSYAGRAQYYRMRYGNYLIGMNANIHKTYYLDVPKEFEHAKVLPGHQRIGNQKRILVKPMSTVVLYKLNY